MINHFLYFIPGLKAGANTKAAILAAVGPAISGCELSCRNVDGGPGQHGPGVIVAAIPRGREVKAGEIERRLEYCRDPARQVWFEASGYWVGYHADLMPGPADLVRSDFVSGYPHTCRETGEWVVPLARYVDGGTNFDERIVYLPNNEIEMRPLKRYERLCSFASEHFERLTRLMADSNDIVVKEDRIYADVAVEALGINYHVGPYELSLLGVITREAAVLICGYLCDWPGLCKVMKARESTEKKTESTDGSLPMSSGELDG